MELERRALLQARDQFITIIRIEIAEPVRRAHAIRRAGAVLAVQRWVERQSDEADLTWGTAGGIDPHANGASAFVGAPIARCAGAHAPAANELGAAADLKLAAAIDTLLRRARSAAAGGAWSDSSGAAAAARTGAAAARAAC